MPEITQNSVSKGHDPGLHDRVKVLIYTRLVFISILLAATIFVGLKEEGLLLGVSVVYIFILIGATIFASLVFSFLLFAIGREREDRLKLLSYLQIVWNLLFATAVVYITGGVDSIFYILYYIDIMLASILLFRTGGLIAASLSSIFYGAILGMEVHGILPQYADLRLPVSGISETSVLSKLVINMLFFYFLALVSSFVSEKLRKTEVLLEEKTVDIKNLEDFNRAIVDSLTSGLITLDAKNRVLSCNEAGLKIFGWYAEDVVGKIFGDVMPEAAGKILNENPGSGAGKKSPWRWEGVIALPKDKRIYLGVNLVPFSVKNLLEGGKIVIFEDLTSYREMEERVKRSEKFAAIGELAAGIAHEIRNPLASMSGAIEMLKQESVQGDGRGRLMDIILRETTRLNYLISDFLNFAKAPMLSREIFNINGLVDETVELFLKGSTAGKQISVERKLPGNVYVSADPQQLKQVIWNLLKNSAQAMADGGKIRLVSSTSKDDRGEYCLSIKDEGIGIMPEDIGRIFSPFFTTKKGGTGLGLATVHKIIEEHDGRITVSSVPGVGSEFKVFLPLKSE